MDDSRINEIAGELDRATPKDGAKVDWRVKELTANRQGLIRLAVEVLRAATCNLPPGHEFTDVDWDYLWVKREEFEECPFISRISRTETVELPPVAPPTGTEKIKSVASLVVVLLFLVFFLCCLVVGCVSILSKV